jgi:hypothetical protein
VDVQFAGQSEQVNQTLQGALLRLVAWIVVGVH